MPGRSTFNLMRIEAYLRVLGDEETIRTIEREAAVPGASIKQLKARMDLPDEPKYFWNWQTPRTSIDPGNPDDGLKALLLAHRLIFPAIKKHQGNIDVYLEMVTRCSQGEEAKGMYLSAETILLLSEVGGAFDNDVIVDALR